MPNVCLGRPCWISLRTPQQRLTMISLLFCGIDNHPALFGEQMVASRLGRYLCKVSLLRMKTYLNT